MRRQEPCVRGLPQVHEQGRLEKNPPIESFIARLPRKGNESRDPIFRQPISIPALEHPSAHALFPAAVDQRRGAGEKNNFANRTFHGYRCAPPVTPP